jgi:FKBP-type peptidyl-prolyl cis-trans isomerase
MKKALLALFSGAILFTACSDKPSTSTEAVLENEIDSVSYALGFLISNSYSQDSGADLNADVIAAAMKNYYANGEESMEIDLTQADGIVQAYARKQYEAKMEKLSREQMAFLEENKTKPGVVTTESGLQYKVLVEGTGDKPTAEDKVKCHYTGRLVNGDIFDSSVERGQPFETQVSGGIIRGWTEALQLMPVGSKWEVYIPAELGYGARGAGQAIPGNATLIFELELLEIIK